MKRIIFTPSGYIIVIFLSWFIVPSHGVSQVVDSFFVAGIHPTASLQFTATGRQLMTLFPFNGKLYSGYGDYGANTGPVDIYSFSPDSLTFAFEAQANTEAIYNFRAMNGMLYAPAIDRKSYGIPGDYIRMDSSGNWLNIDFGSASTHVFDAGNFNDSVLFMAGSQNSNAVVWKSTDNGQNWSKILTDTAISGITGDFARFYFAGMYNGNLYVQAKDFNGPMHPYSKVYDGTTWTTGPSLFSSLYWYGSRPEVFAGKLVYASWTPGTGGSSPLRSFDGINNLWVDSLWVYDSFIDSNFYYALVDSGWGTRNLRRTTDLINWENLLTVPDSSRSLAILNDKLFIGTIDSKILQYSLPVSLLTKSVQMLNPDNSGITIYPNPATDFIQVNFPKGNTNFEIEIFNVLGEIKMWLHNENRIVISQLAKGIYLVKIREGKDFYLQKFVKQ